MPMMNNEYVDIPSTRGNLQFSGSFTGNPLADFLLGYVFNAELSNVHIVNQRRSSMAFYVQDDWKPSDALTLSLGLRYDFMTPSLEADNRQANIDPATGTLVFAKDGSLEERALVKPDRNNFAPRLGLVYRLNETTVLRKATGSSITSWTASGPKISSRSTRLDCGTSACGQARRPRYF